MKHLITLFSAFFLIGCGRLFGQVDHWETIVYDTSTWRYIVPAASTSMNWIQPSFDASTWNSGNGGFGFADTIPLSV